MTPYRIKPALIVFMISFLFIAGCNKTRSSDAVDTPGKTPSLIGVWQQAVAGDKDMSGAGVKMIINEDVLTMEAPGCVIEGKYKVAGDLLSFTITSVKGGRCAGDQKIGGGGSVGFTVTDTQLTLHPSGGDKNRQIVYTRVPSGKTRPVS